MSTGSRIVAFVFAFLTFSVALANDLDSDFNVSFNDVSELCQYVGIDKDGVVVRLKNKTQINIPFQSLTDENKEWLYNRFGGSSRRALLVGSVGYDANKNLRSPYSSYDVAAVAEMLEKDLGFLKKDIRILSSDSPSEDMKPTARNIFRELDALIDLDDADNKFLFVYFSGLGYYKREKNETVDYYLSKDKPIQLKIVYNRLITSPYFFKWVVFDVDRMTYESLRKMSMGTRGLSRGDDLNLLNWVKFAKASPGYALVNSCSLDQARNDDRSRQLGLFTANLIDAVEGKAAKSEGKDISLSFMSVLDSAILATEEDSGKKQTPVISFRKFSSNFCLPTLPETSDEIKVVRDEVKWIDHKGADVANSDVMTKYVDGVEYNFCWLPGESCWILDSEVSVQMWRSFVKEMGDPCGRGVRNMGGCGYLNDYPKIMQSPELTWKNPGKGFDGDLDLYPVVQVDYLATSAFCKWLGDKLAMKCDLPSQDEWEYAYVAGGHSNDDYVMPKTKDGFAFCNQARSGAPNKLKLYNMTDNVAEWTRTDVKTDYGLQKFVAGKGFMNNKCLGPASPYIQACFIGFRVVLRSTSAKPQ